MKLRFSVLALCLSAHAQTPSPSPVRADHDLLRSASTMTVPQLEEAIDAYERLGNTTMSARLIEVLENKNGTTARRSAEEKDEPEAVDEAEKNQSDPQAQQVSRHTRSAEPAEPDTRAADAAEAVADAAREKFVTRVSALLDDENGGPPEAREALTLLDAHPFSAPEFRLLRGRALAQCGRYDEAALLLAPLANDAALDPATRADAALALRSCGFEKLRDAYDRAVTADLPPRSRAIIAGQLAEIAPDDLFTLEAQCSTFLLLRDPASVRDLLQRHANALREDSGLRSHDIDARILLGDYEPAIAGLDSLAADATLSNSERFSCANDADEMARLVSAGIDAGALLVDEAQGRWWVATLGARTARFADRSWQFLFHTRLDTMSLDQIHPHDARDQRWNNEITARRWFGAGNFAEAGIGVSDEADAYFHLAIARAAIHRWGGGLRYDHQAPALDCVALRALDGRENRAAFSIEGTLAPGLTLCADLAWRAVTLDHSRIGEGWHISASLTRQLAEETAARPRIWIALNSEAGQLSLKHKSIAGADITDLLDPRLQRHEIELGAAKSLSERLAISSSIAAGYDVDDECAVWRAGLALDLRITAKTKLSIGVQHDSSGVGANSGSGMTQAFARMSTRW